MARNERVPSSSRFPFPDRPRLWGVAVSHYQVEGNDNCDWTDWEAAGRTRGEPCGDAAGSWTRYEEDARLARDAGANAFRFSVSWSRVAPAPGEWDSVALGRYRALVETLAALDLEPIVTLFHYTHPRWFHERTPWTSPSSVDAFALFARKVAQALGRRVRLYTIFNEPLVLVLGGYVDGQIPPGLKDVTAASRAFTNLLTAHCASAAAIREVTPGAVISVAHNMMSFAPERPFSVLDRACSWWAHRVYNRALPEAFATGAWSFSLPPFGRFRGRLKDLPASLDVLGVNFYSRLHLRCPGSSRLGTSQLLIDYGYIDRTRRGLTDNGWEIVPEALLSILKEAAGAGFPLLITENGLADASDTRRGAFLRDHAAVLERAEALGIPVHGYLHWSLLDNFEWLDGYSPRFGLFELDRVTMERRPRASVAEFRRLGASYLNRTFTRV